MTNLLALYGEDTDDRMAGFSFRRARKRARRLLKKTPHARAARAIRRRLHGDERVSGYEELSGKKRRFLPGLRKIGKATRKFTTAAASAFVPKATLDLVSKLDPTKKRKSKVVAVKAVVPVKADAMKIDAKKIAIIGGAGISGLILVKVLTAPRPRPMPMRY